MNLPEILDPGKRRGRALYITLIIVLVGVGAFALGRLSAKEESQGGIRIVGERVSASAIEAFKEIASTTAPQSELRKDQVRAGAVVASKSGSKYHFPWCSGGQTISEQNKIWFESTDAARKAGYIPASNCKGLQ